MPRNPVWTREELILALDLYMEHRGAIPGKGSKPISDLSSTLNRMASALGLVAGDERFRNEAGVYMKLMNFLPHDPTYTGVGLSAGGKRDGEVWEEFSSDRQKLRQAAAEIRRQLDLVGDLTLPPPEGEGSEEFPEGRLAHRIHLARERNQTAIRRKKQDAQSRFGCLRCEVCGFDFEVTYGEVGRGYIECHHLIPVTEWSEGDQRTRLADLALVCPNCHRMLHRANPALTVEELRSRLS